jgi:DNA-binding MarR family transcriptional regulator
MNKKCHTRCEEMLRQTALSFPEIDGPGMRFIARLFRLRDLVFENAQREMAAFGLSPAEFSVLSTLRRSSPPHELRPSQIYKGMLLTSGGLTKVLNTLEQRGLLERRAEAEDRRGCRVRLTPAGISLAERALQAVIGSDTAMLGRVAGLEQLDALAESLRPFTETLDK